jgi:cation diffusion facilitator family transporter
VDRRVKAASVSVVSNTTVLAMKLVTGILTGSVSIMSAAIDSLNDLSASTIALFSVRAASAPADREHPYGHGKFENISGAAQALLIFVAAVYIINESVKKIITPAPIVTPGLGAAVMAATAVIDLYVSRYLLRVALETDSAALRADAYHLTTDVWTSLGAMGALIVVYLTGFRLIDPIVALVIAGAVVRVAYRLTKDAAVVLVDVRLPDEEMALISDTIMRTPGIVGYHRLRTRKSGPHREVDYHLIVPASMPVDEAHAIAQDIEDGISGRYPGAHVITHVEPDTEEVMSEPGTEVRGEEAA